MHFNIYKETKIKCEVGIKTEVLDCEFTDQVNYNIKEEIKSEYNSETLKKVGIKEETHEFEEEFHDIEDMDIKSEYGMKDDNNTVIGSNGKRHICEICKKTLSSKNSLRRHLFIHSGEKNYKCNICEKSFSCKKGLTQHMAVHGEKNFLCPICGKLFSQRGYVNIHQSTIHTGEKNYKCDICGKSYFYSNALQQHLAVHTGEKNFKCTLCDKSFSQNSYLKSHHSIVHTGAKKKRKRKG